MNEVLNALRAMLAEFESAKPSVPDLSILKAHHANIGTLLAVAATGSQATAPAAQAAASNAGPALHTVEHALHVAEDAIKAAVHAVEGDDKAATPAASATA